MAVQEGPDSDPFEEEIFRVSLLRTFRALNVWVSPEVTRSLLIRPVSVLIAKDVGAEGATVSTVTKPEVVVAEFVPTRFV